MSKFDSVFTEYYGVKKEVKPALTPIQPAVKNTTVITEKVVQKLPKVHLVSAKSPFDDETVVTVETITPLGFQKASPEEFVGAGKDTYFLEVENVNGRTTLVYDFQPLGNHGKPALHLYFNSNEKPISESLVCFAVSNYTVGSLKQIIESSKHLHPSQSKSIHNIKSVQGFITEVTNDSKQIID